LYAATGSFAYAQPAQTIDVADLGAEQQTLSRVYGSATGSHLGQLGVPVAGGMDVDGDGNLDYAMATMLASPASRTCAGEVHLVLGNGATAQNIDTADPHPRTVRIVGAKPSEMAGSEIWMDDVTGDGLGDLLICRQNFTPDSTRPGAGSLTILAGAPTWTQRALDGDDIDLANPPADLDEFTIHGAEAGDRFCVWVRSGDIDGDHVSDILVGADQQDNNGALDSGGGYAILGGNHLQTSATLDLRQLDEPNPPDYVARILPPVGTGNQHLGGTVQIADLDGNGRGELLLADTINRAGADNSRPGCTLASAVGSGGSPHGTVYIAWDDNFPPAPWPAGLTLRLGALPGTQSTLTGASENKNFGEEMLGGLDYNDDGHADLFLGDLAGDGTGVRAFSGLGYVVYDAAQLKGLTATIDQLPPSIHKTMILGPIPGAIAGDTAMQGDFDGDGVADLALSSPHNNPFNRSSAGSIHVLFGQAAPWPEQIDLAPEAIPETSIMRIAAIHGAHGGMAGDVGDTLAYSGAAGDIDGDGRDDLIINEMLGNGLSEGTVDVGNLIVIPGKVFGGPPNTPPKARFRASCDGLDCSFDASGSSDPDGVIVRYDWYFEDAQRGSGVRVSHRFKRPDLYQVTLQVTDDLGAKDSLGVIAKATIQPPTALFTYRCRGLSCWFRAQAGDVDGVDYRWVFDDAGGGTGVMPRHRFKGSGSHRVRLSATDLFSQSRVSERVIHLRAPSHPK